MKLYLYLPLVLGLALAGCGKSKPAVDHLYGAPTNVDGSIGAGSWICENCTGTVTHLPPSHEAQVYAELWRVCEARKLTYRVQSFGSLGYRARAWKLNKGELLEWTYWQNGPTEAADGLLNILTGPPKDCTYTLFSECKFTNDPSNFDTGEVRP